MGVIGELLGVDAEFLDRLHHLSSRVVATDIGPAEAVAANRELVAVLAAVAAARAERASDDIVAHWPSGPPSRVDV
jgi:cytochrome P450